MANGTFYVCPDHPSASDASGYGGAAATAYATLGYALTNANGINSGNGLEQNDIVYVGPGVSEENGTAIVLDEASSNIPGSGTEAKIIGDPNAQLVDWGTSVHPGECRVTFADSSTKVPQELTGTGMNMETNAPAYIEIYDMTFDGVDGSADDYTVKGDSATAGQKLVRCNVIGGRVPVEYLECYECVLYGTYSGAANCEETAHNGKLVRCFMTGGEYSVASSDTFDCFLFGGRYGVGDGIHLNPTVMGGYYVWNGVTANSDELANALILSGYQWTGAAGDPEHNLALSIYRDVSGRDYSSCRATYIHNIWEGTNPATDGHTLSFPPAGDVIRNLASAFAVREYNDYGIGDHTSVSDETRDILGRARTIRDSGSSSSFTGQGAVAITDFDVLRDATDGNTIRIQKLGDYVMFIPLKADTAITIDVDIESSHASPSSQPQLVLEPTVEDGSAGFFTADTDTAASQTDTLQVSLAAGDAPDEDTIARLIFRSRSITAAHYCDFHSLVIA